MAVLITTGMLLVEILLVALGVYLFLRFRRKRKLARQAAGQGGEAGKPGVGHILLLDHIQAEINRMEAILDPAQQAVEVDRKAIGTRLGFYTRERKALTWLSEHVSESVYWTEVGRHYAQDEGHDTPTAGHLQAIIGEYQKRVDALEQYRQLFRISQQQLHESINIIAELQRRIAQPHPTDLDGASLDQRLQIETTRLREQLGLPDEQMQTLMHHIPYMADASAPSSAQAEEELRQMARKLHQLEEENDFLQQQIQFLLKQEVDKTSGLHARIDELENELAGVRQAP